MRLSLQRFRLTKAVPLAIARGSTRAGPLYTSQAPEAP